VVDDGADSLDEGVDPDGLELDVLTKLGIPLNYFKILHTLPMGWHLQLTAGGCHL
jgi:hypothetical protein